MSTTRPPVPVDDALPAMPRMLDVDAMAPILERSLGGDRSIDRSRSATSATGQGRNLLVRYEVTIDGTAHGVVALAEPGGSLARSAQEPANLELAAKVVGSHPCSQSPLAYEDDLGILVQWTPLDLAAAGDGRAAGATPSRSSRTPACAPASQGALPQLVHFKPNRRGVLRYGEHFVKIYAEDKAYERAVAGMLAADALPMRSARLDAAIPELRLTAQSFVEGVPPAGPVEAAPAAGAFLAMLHGTPNDSVRSTPPAHRLESHARVRASAGLDRAAARAAARGVAAPPRRGHAGRAARALAR